MYQYTLLPLTACYLSLLQMHCDLDGEVSKVPHNHPYLVAMVAANAVRFYHIAERVVLCEATSFTQGLMTLIATFYQFVVVYPKPLIPILTFVKKVVMNVSASTQVPNSVTKLVSSLDKIIL